MRVEIHPHAQIRLVGQGATIEEAIATVKQGRASPADFGRTRFRLSFPSSTEWRDKPYATKQIDAISTETAPDEWLIITVIIKFF